MLMKPPIFVRTLSKEERKALQAGLRSSDAFVLRRCQILLSSARGESPPQIARSLGCASQTVRNAIHAFNERGLDALKAGSSRPKRTRAAFDEQGVEALKELLRHPPREFGKPTTLWTLEHAAEVSFEEGITEERESLGRRFAPRSRGWECAGRGPRGKSRLQIPSTKGKRG